MNSPGRTAGCALCNNPAYLKETAVFHALDKNWHVRCFRCSDCCCLLSQTYYYKNSQLYCRKHYMKRFNHICNSCNQKIVGPIMLAGDVPYHPECFLCISCQEPLNYDDEFILVENSKLFCVTCYKRETLRSVSTAFSQNMRNQLLTLHLRVSVTSNAVAVLYSHHHPALNSLSRTTDWRSEGHCIVVANPGKVVTSSAIKSGDRVIEVNGVLVTSSNSKELSVLLSMALGSYTITLERFPGHQGQGMHSYISNNCMFPTDDVAELPEFEHRSSLSNMESMDLSPSFETGASDRFLLKKSRSSEDLSRSTSRRACTWGINRTHSQSTFRNTGEVFRPSDLLFQETLGEGFFGRVIKVTHMTTGRVMVVKQLKTVSRQAQSALVKEVLLMRNLKHPNVVKFIGLMYKDGDLNVILEYISGGTLRNLIKSSEEIPWSERIRFAKDIASGMAYLHSVNIIHRDLKSKNCLIKETLEGRFAVVGDLGLSTMDAPDCEIDGPLTPSRSPCKSPGWFKHTPGSMMPRSKKRNTIVGSPYWMAPEMLTGKFYDERIDIFSYGIVLCELIARVKANPDILPRTDDFGLDEQKIRTMSGPECPRVLLELAFCCCSIDPDRRPPFSTAEGWLEHLTMLWDAGAELPDVSSFNVDPPS